MVSSIVFPVIGERVIPQHRLLPPPKDERGGLESILLLDVVVVGDDNDVIAGDDCCNRAPLLQRDAGENATTAVKTALEMRTR